MMAALPRVARITDLPAAFDGVVELGPREDSGALPARFADIE
jgi:hypothetical protein